MAEARRTLVKSPPELWALISDRDCLAKHLEAFGEIRITRTELETIVAWEGDRARGTVELEPSGWGTKVRLTAETIEVEEPEPVAEEPEPEPEPVAEEPEPEPEPAPLAENAAAQQPLAAEEPEPETRKGLFARWFGRRRELRVTTIAEELDPIAEEPAPVVEEPAAVVEEPEPVLAEEPPPEPEPVAVEEPEGEEIRVERLRDEEAETVLAQMLDSLGSAHHRPFSRG